MFARSVHVRSVYVHVGGRDVCVRVCSGALSLCAALCSEKKEIVCLYLYVCVSSNEGIYACL